MSGSTSGSSPDGTPTSYLTLDCLNPDLIDNPFAIRGMIYDLFLKIKTDLAEASTEYPFKELIYAVAGDSQAFGYAALTFFRQMLAVSAYPPLLDSPDIPEDVKSHSRQLCGELFGGSIACYIERCGTNLTKNAIVKYIQSRDGLPADPGNCIVVNGFERGALSLMHYIAREHDGKKSSIMLPVPQFSLYEYGCKMHGLEIVKYFLDEDKEWSLDIEELERAYTEAKDSSVIKMIIIINPGNPTGQVLRQQNIRDIIEFANRRKLIILADEVYQEMIWNNQSQFFSFKKEMHNMGEPYSRTPLVSGHSLSKTMLRECGSRGAYFEFVNFEPELMRCFIDMMGPPNPCGTIGLYCLGNPPQPGDASYPVYNQEISYFRQLFKRKADMLSELLNTVPGITCQSVQGALYAMPRVHLPPGFVQEAKDRDWEPDSLYCHDLLLEEGVAVVQGNVFGQRAGSYHFRMTIVPPEEQLRRAVERIGVFTGRILAKYAN